jgi:hypothetical protein
MESSRVCQTLGDETGVKLLEPEMRVNGTRRFYLIQTKEEAFGAWVDENDRLIQVPKQWHDLMRAPLSELMARVKLYGYQIEDTGKKM